MSTCVDICRHLSTLVDIRPPERQFPHKRPVSTFVDNCPLLSTFVDFPRCAGNTSSDSILQSFCPLLSTFVHFCPLLSTFVHFCPLLSTLVHFCPLWYRSRRPQIWGRQPAHVMAPLLARMSHHSGHACHVIHVHGCSFMIGRAVIHMLLSENQSHLWHACQLATSSGSESFRKMTKHISIA